MLFVLKYNTFMKNPMKKYKTLTSALKSVGFDIELPKRYKLKEIYVIADKILELRYSTVIVRKAKYNKNIQGLNGISGVYQGAYPNDCNKGDFEKPGIKGNEYWNGSAKNPKAYLAVWDDLNHKYSYSVYAPKGIKLISMDIWQKNLK